MKRNCVIFDLDGTMSNDKWRRQFAYDGDFDKYFSGIIYDPPVEMVCRLYRRMHDICPIFILTGRPDKCLNDTLYWFKINNIELPDAFMFRLKGERSKTSVVKSRMLKTVQTKYDPLFAVEDNEDVINMYRSYGINCIIPEDVLKIDNGDCH